MKFRSQIPGYFTEIDNFITFLDDDKKNTIPISGYKYLTLKDNSKKSESFYQTRVKPKCLPNVVSVALIATIYIFWKQLQTLPEIGSLTKDISTFI